MKTTNPVFTTSSAHFLGGVSFKASVPGLASCHSLLKNLFSGHPDTNPKITLAIPADGAQHRLLLTRFLHCIQLLRIKRFLLPFPYRCFCCRVGLLLPFGLITHLSVVDGRDQLVCCLSLLPCVSVVSWGPSPPLNWAQRWLGALGCLFHKQHKCVCFQLCHSQHYRNVHIPAFSVLALGHTAA